MKKFKFRLERVLQYRLLIKEDRRRDLTLARMKLQQDEERLEQLEHAFMSNELEVGEHVSVQEFMLRGTYAERLKNEMIQQRLSIIQAHQAVEVALDAYLEAAKDAEALETLKKKRREEYTQYVLKEDEKFLDELATQKGNRLGQEDRHGS